MSEPDVVREARTRLGSMCPEPIEAALLVMAAKGHGNRKDPTAKKLKTFNYLVLTPTSIRLFSLSGRLTPKKEIATFSRGQVVVRTSLEDEDSRDWDTGTTHHFRVHVLTFTGPGADFAVKTVADAGLHELERDVLEAAYLEAETDPDAREGIQGLQEMAAETEAMVAAFAASS